MPETGRFLANSSLGPPKGGNKVVQLPHGTSLLDVRAALPAPTDKEAKEGLRIVSLDSSLIESSPQYFASHATDVRARWR